MSSSSESVVAELTRGQSAKQSEISSGRKRMVDSYNKKLVSRDTSEYLTTRKAATETEQKKSTSEVNASDYRPCVQGPNSAKSAIYSGSKISITQYKGGVACKTLRSTENCLPF